jgi:SAM-dependent methyltransferase
MSHLLEAVVSSTSRVLDVGCGDGRTCGLWLRDHAAEYVGVDISELAIREARAAGLDARLIQDATDLPFADGQFDVVVCVECSSTSFCRIGSQWRSGEFFGQVACAS